MLQEIGMGVVEDKCGCCRRQVWVLWKISVGVVRGRCECSRG